MRLYKDSGRKRKHALLALSLFFILSISGGISFVKAQTDEQEEELKRQFLETLLEINTRIKEHQSKVEELKQEKITLKKEIEIFENDIERVVLESEATTLRIQETNAQIVDRERTVERLELQVESEREILAELLRTFDSREQATMVEILLEKETLSDFFSELHAIEDLQSRIQALLKEIHDLKIKLNGEISALEKEKEELANLLTLLTVQKSSLEKKRQLREELLEFTRGEEFRYQKMIRAENIDAEKIRKQLYELEEFGVALEFQDALTFAEKAAGVTGVRPAFLLAILQLESNWGRNLGSGNWAKDMHPDQRQAFLEITEGLGLDPDKTPVSAKPSYGWGGAMGPAQFIPKTWLAYEKDIAAATGHNPPSPWNVEDAFAAAAIKLARDGAYVRTPQSEWKAAMIYFAGSNWDNPAFKFYGDTVLEYASELQDKIDIIKHSEA